MADGMVRGTPKKMGMEDYMTSIVDVVMNNEKSNHPAIVDGSGVTSYRELVELTRRLAGGLESKLPSQDDLCLIISLPGLAESIALSLAAWWLGLRVAVLPSYLKAREREVVLSKCSPAITVAADSPDSPDSFSFTSLLD